MTDTVVQLHGLLALIELPLTVVLYWIGAGGSVMILVYIISVTTRVFIKAQTDCKLKIEMQ